MKRKRCGLVLLLATTLFLLVGGCEEPREQLDTFYLSVPDSTQWTCYVRSSYGNNSRYYYLEEPLLAWRFFSDSGGSDSERARGFLAFRTNEVAIPPDDIRSCTLNYFVRGTGGAPPVLHDCAVNVPNTPANLLYASGEDVAVLGTDTGTHAGWHRVPLNTVGLATLKDKIRYGIKVIGFCFDYHGSETHGGEAAGHDAPERPFLTIVYATHASSAP